MQLNWTAKKVKVIVLGRNQLGIYYRFTAFKSFNKSQLYPEESFDSEMSVRFPVTGSIANVR